MYLWFINNIFMVYNYIQIYIVIKLEVFLINRMDELMDGMDGLYLYFKYIIFLFY